MIITLLIVGIALLLLGVVLIAKAFGGPTSTGNGAGVMGGLILIALAVPSVILGGASLFFAFIFFLIKHFA
jgi:hypothetical protein